MSALAIQDVTNAIAARLQAAVTQATPAAAPGSARVFVGTLDDAQALNSSLVLFLHRTNPCQALRNSPHIVPPAIPGDKEQVYTAALPLDLHYLVTVGRQQASEPEELRLLGFAMQALNDDPVFVGAAVGGQVARLTLDVATSDELSRIWALFPTVNYRTSVLYLASPVWIDPRLPETPAAPVILQRSATGVLA